MKKTLTAQLRAAIDARIADGETLYAIADRAGVSRQTLYRWYASKRDIYLASADKLAAAVGVTAGAK